MANVFIGLELIAMQQFLTLDFNFHTLTLCAQDRTKHLIGATGDSPHPVRITSNRQLAGFPCGISATTVCAAKQCVLVMSVNRLHTVPLQDLQHSGRVCNMYMSVQHRQDDELCCRAVVQTSHAPKLDAAILYCSPASSCQSPAMRKSGLH